MANIGGPKSAKRRLLMTSNGSGSKKVRAPGSLFVKDCCGASCVGDSWDSAQERKQVYKAKRSGQNKADAKRVAQKDILLRWQQKWSEETRGRWTTRLIPSIAPWVGRKHGEVNYYFTQFLSGHGYFKKYLFRMGKTASPLCGYGCHNEEDGAEHTLFGCSHRSAELDTLRQKVGPVTPDNSVRVMLESTEKWSAIANYAPRLLQKKKKEENRWSSLVPV
ncbi:hypothetical protein ANTRET_LOCUS1665 [Anthophora retusa]